MFASVMPALMGNPAETGESMAYSKHLARQERRNLETVTSRTSSSTRADSGTESARRGVMDEEFIVYDQLNIPRKIGLA